MQDLAQLSSSPVYVAASKLDADQYMAQDIDGATESLFGSGNLNFLMMQAGQSNELLSSVAPFSLAGEGELPSSAFVSANEFGAGTQSFSTNYAYDSDGGVAGGGQSLPLGNSDGIGDFSGGDATVVATNSLGGSGLAANNGGAGAITNNGGFTALTGTGQDGQSGTNGTSGSDGQDGGGQGGGDTTIINNNYGDINLGDIDLGDVINIEDVTSFLTETITNLTDIINNIEITDLTENLLTQIFETTNNLIDNITTIIGDVTDITEILHVTEIVNNLVDNIFNLTEGLENGLTLNLDAVLSEILSLDADLVQGDVVTQLVDQVLDLTPLTDQLDGVLDLSGIDLADIGSSIGLLGGDPDARDPNQDIDLGLDLTGNLGGLELVDSITDVVVDPVEDILGDVDILGDIGLNLLNSEAIDNGAGDSDLTLGTDLDLLDSDVAGLDVDIPIDFVETLTGDIDLDLGIAGDLLGGSADELVDSITGGSDTPNIISDVGGNLQDLAGDIAGDVLPGFTDGEIVTGTVDLLNTDNISNAAGDTDLNLEVELDLIDTDIIDLDLPEINLDAVEAITGDIDLDVDAALDLLGSDVSSSDILGDILDSVTNTLDDVGGDWTENILPGGDDISGDVFGGVLDAVLPDPVGTVAEGLGSLIPGGEDVSGGLSGSGLFGGGLFG